MTIEFTSSNTRPRRQSRDWRTALVRGFFGRCPNCGKGRTFTRYLKVAESCSSCSEELHHHQADDAPPYFTIFIVGHIVVPLVLAVEHFWQPEIWVHFSLWLPLTLGLTLLLLPAVKGAVVGLQWALRMHGFEYTALCSPHNRSDGQ